MNTQPDMTPSDSPIDYNKAQQILTTSTGDPCYLYKDSLLVELIGRRRVASTSSINGGTRTDIRYLFNHSCSQRREVREKINCVMQENNLREYYEGLCTGLGLPLEHTVGMSTAAKVENYGVATRRKYDVEVSVIATAGIDVNAGRAGDKATYDEFAHANIIPSPGTINMMLFINARLDSGILTRAIVTATEAKTVVTQELMAASKYSEGIATGSGTDTIAVVGNEESSRELFDAGKHVLLGEMIGEASIEALRIALEKQSGMTPHRQASIEWQGVRYGITRQSIAEAYHTLYNQPLPKEVEHKWLDEMLRDNRWLGITAATLHLCDQNRWGMISETTLAEVAKVNRDLVNGHVWSEAKTKECNYKEVITQLVELMAQYLHSKTHEA